MRNEYVALSIWTALHIWASQFPSNTSFLIIRSCLVKTNAHKLWQESQWPIWICILRTHCMSSREGAGECVWEQDTLENRNKQQIHLGFPPSSTKTVLFSHLVCPMTTFPKQVLSIGFWTTAFISTNRCRASGWERLRYAVETLEAFQICEQCLWSEASLVKNLLAVGNVSCFYYWFVDDTCTGYVECIEECSLFLFS